MIGEMCPEEQQLLLLTEAWTCLQRPQNNSVTCLALMFII